MTGLTWRLLGRAGVLMLAVILALGTAVPAYAQEEGLERRGFSGMVTDLQEGSITVETEDGELITVALTEDTRVRLPSAGVQSVLEVELREGARVAILAEVEVDGSLTALWTLVKPERPQIAHLLGTVISIEGNSVTIVDAQGNEHTVEMPGQALQGLQIGDMTTLVVDQPDDDGDEPETLEAHEAVTARDIQARVLMHASSLRQRAEAGDVPVDDAAERIQFLSDLMDTINTHVQGVLTSVLDKVPLQAKAAIERAMEQARTGFEQAKGAIQRQGPPEGVGPPSGVGPSGIGPSDSASDNDTPARVGPPEETVPPGGGDRPGR